MISVPDEVAPAYRLYTSEEAAKRVGGGGRLGERLFRRLAAAGEVECTRMGGGIFWTDAQIAAAVAHHASKSKSKSKTEASAPRAIRTVPAPRSRQQRAPLVATPGRRYQTLESR